MKTIRVPPLSEEMQIELEIQAEEAGMSVREYAAELLHEALKSMAGGDNEEAGARVLH
ncbi:hypothetical protein ACQKEK_02355 [Pseudomonas sp. NPDC077408]|uniref:hypothetical protein n=1 Tax=Streptomyces parvus TaxID=66428 RepID=UPI00372498E8